MLIGNAYEIESILQKIKLNLDDIKKIVRVLVVTNDKAGSTIYNNGDVISIPSILPRRIADPTGAGDAYRAGLLTGYIKGLSWQNAGQIATILATYAIETIGTQNHLFKLGEFSKRYFENYKSSNEIQEFFTSLSLRDCLKRSRTS